MRGWMLVLAVFDTACVLTVVRSVILAQASSSRLGESIRMLTLVQLELLAQATNLGF